jgi:hypothetical protein
MGQPGGHLGQCFDADRSAQIGDGLADVPRHLV